MFNGKMKAVTFSYDDGVTQDVRLIELLNKYNLKCTFNINSALLGREGFLIREAQTVNHTRINAADVKHIYAGHEVAAHTLTHPALIDCSRERAISEVENDRIALSELVEYEVVGMAYPGGTGCFNDETVDVIRNHTGIKYARTTTSTYSFDLRDDLITFNPTVYHHREWDAMFSLGEKFIELKTDRPQIFYIWGHAYEFDIHNTWDRFEEFCKLISGKDDIFYGTNKEILLKK
ncbi:MAG: polysaccharide deacetylase family protein [Monoglobales bacterium]